jgi:hypothetical protein
MKSFTLPLLALLVFTLHSCIVERPPYSKVEKVLTLKLGMSMDTISKILDIPPYDLRSLDDSSGQTVLVYKYRVTDRRTLPFFVKPRNGMRVSGKYRDLAVTYDKDGKATHFESSDTDVTEKETKIVDINKVINLIAVIAPAVLIYLGIKTTQ